MLFNQLYKRISLEYFPSCPQPQNRFRAIFNFLTNYEKDYNRQTTAHMSFMYMYSCIHTLGYKIKSLTLLKFQKQTRVKLAGNPVSSPSVVAIRFE